MLIFQSLAAAVQAVVGGVAVTPPDLPVPERICQFGYSIECVGDLDGDGTSEFVIGTPFDSVKSPTHEYGERPVDSGGIWVCSVEKSRVLAQLRGDASGARLGECIAGISHTPGAPTQCVVGEPGFAGGRGRVRVLELPSLHVQRDIEGSDVQGGFGRSVALVEGAGADIRVAVTSQSLGGARVPAAIYIADASSGVVKAKRAYDLGDVLSRDLAVVADLTGDGILEVAVGVAPPAGDPGRVEVLSGRDLAPVRIIAGERGELSGLSLAPVSLQRGVSRNLLMGCPGYLMGAESVGAIRLVDLDSSNQPRVLTAANGNSGDRWGWGFRGGSGFGMAVTSVADITGDGVLDVAVGAPKGTFRFDSECGFIALHDGASGKLVMDCNWPLRPSDKNLQMLGFGSAVKSCEVLDRGSKKAMLAVSAARHRVSLGASGVVVFDLSQPLPTEGSMNSLHAVARWQLTYDESGFRSMRLNSP